MPDRPMNDSFPDGLPGNPAGRISAGFTEGTAQARRRPGQPRLLPLTLDAVGYQAGGTGLLHGLDLELRAGQLTVLMGANGAGKSLTLRLIQGLIRPTAGRIRFADGTLFGPSRQPAEGHAGRVAMVFQRPVLLRRSVAGNLRHALRVYRVPAREREERVTELLQVAGLAGLQDRPARVLSSGEQQRLSIVRAIAAEPELLLLDEPTANLDPQSTQAIEALIRTAERRGATVVLVTHDVGQARRMADRVIFVHCGRVTEDAAAARFFDHPRSEAARAYLDGRLFI